jgi:MFS superfamily sulfate permease-like transporter
MAPYKQTCEKNYELKMFRIKLIELFILSLSAILVLLTFTRNKILIYPSALIILDTIIILIVLMFGANKNKEQIEFEQGSHTLKNEVEMTQISYEFSIWEYISLCIYLISIILFGLAMFIYI